MILSCNPSKKLDKLNAKHPELLAKFCSDTFPCIISKIDTITSFDTVYSAIKINENEELPKDTIWLTKNKTLLINRPVYLASKYPVKTIVKVIKDSAEVSSIRFELNKCNEEGNKFITENRKLQNKVTAKNRLIIWLIIALLCSILCNVIQLKK
jgi:uncharacterized protein with PIN domain